MCSNSKQQLLILGVTAAMECTCAFTDHNAILKMCNRPFTDHRDDQIQPHGISKLGFPVLTFFLFLQRIWKLHHLSVSIMIHSKIN
jgi:hypothetical protein